MSKTKILLLLLGFQAKLLLASLKEFAGKTTKKEVGYLMLLKNTKGFYCSLMINHLQTKVKTNVGLNFSKQHHFFKRKKSTKYYAKKYVVFLQEALSVIFSGIFTSNLWALKKRKNEEQVVDTFLLHVPPLFMDLCARNSRKIDPRASPRRIGSKNWNQR